MSTFVDHVSLGVTHGFGSSFHLKPIYNLSTWLSSPQNSLTCVQPRGTKCNCFSIGNFFPKILVGKLRALSLHTELTCSSPHRVKVENMRVHLPLSPFASRALWPCGLLCRFQEDSSCLNTCLLSSEWRNKWVAEDWLADIVPSHLYQARWLEQLTVCPLWWSSG